MEQEIWKNVLGYEGLYQISNMGNIKSLDRVIQRKDGRNYIKKGRVLNFSLTSWGYKIAVLYKNTEQKTYLVHKLMAINFLNHVPCGHKKVVNHKDFNRLNNKLSNLEIVSQRENTNKKHLESSSKFTGVSFSKKTNSWTSSIHIEGEKVYLGSCKSEEEASELYEKALIALNKKEEIYRKVRKKVSTFKYVTFQKGADRWKAGHNYGDMKHLGYFNTELEAKEAVDNYLKNKQNTTQCVV
jgi:uncharacterized protein YlbG (UPF0298 family)